MRNPTSAALLLISLVLPLGCGRVDLAGEGSAPPGIILISVDTLRADRLGCYTGGRIPFTPHMDALAREGVLFESHTSSSSWTTPAHMSIFTGLHPSGHRVTASFKTLERSIKGGGQFPILDWARETLPQRLRREGYRTGAFTAGGTVAPDLGFGRGFETYRQDMHKLDDQNMGHMYQWLGNLRPGEMYFLFWHNFQVHAPYLNPDFLGQVMAPREARLMSSRLREIASYPGIYKAMGERPQAQRLAQRQVMERSGAWNAKVAAVLYDGGVAAFDRWFGAFVEHLKATGMYDRSLIVLTADHGDEFAERTPDAFYDQHGHTLYQEVVHVPLVIKLPGGRFGGTRVTNLSSSVDLLPTIMDLVDLEPSTGTTILDGRTLRPEWTSVVVPEPNATIVMEGLATGEEKKAVRRERFKLILSVDEATVERLGRGQLSATVAQRELYDIFNDPAERVNLLAADPVIPEHAGIAATLEAYLRGYLEKIGPSMEDRVMLDEETIIRLKELGYTE